MIIPKIENSDFAKVFDTLESTPIACCNWQSQYPYTPTVSFKGYHDGKYFYLRYDVDEQASMAKVEKDQGEVWTDSCVEFFIAPDDNGYYNFETSCIGKMLLANRKSRNDANPAPMEVMESVKRYPSLPAKNFDEKPVGHWSMTLAIPATALFKHSLESWDGVTVKANLYKCGDNLSVPHFLSWQPIATEKPDFHRPEFFGTLTFAE